MHKSHQRALISFAAGISLIAAHPIFAANGIDLWTGIAGDNNWATGGNWTGINAPPIAGDVPTFGAQGAGSLTLNNNLTAATSYLGLTFNAGAPSFTLNGNSITSTGGIVDNSANPELINLPIIMSGSHSVNAINGGIMTLDGVISGSASGITKTGGGTVLLNGSAVNTYTGPTTVNAGLLQVNFSNLGATANLISSSSVLTFGGGTLQIQGNASSASSQQFASTTLNAGNSTISAAPFSGSFNPTVTLGAFTEAAGGTVVINGPASSTAPTTASGQTGSAGNGSTVGFQAATATVTTTSGTANQIFQSSASGNAAYYCYGTVGLYDFAALSGSSPFTIVGYSQISSSTSGLGTAGNGSYFLDTTGFSVNNAVAQTHVEDIAASFSPSANTTSLGGYRYNFSGPITTTLSGVQSVGAILVTPNVGANNDTIAEGSSGVLQPGWRSSSNGGSLAIYQNNIEGFLTFGVVLSDGKTAGGSWVQAGAGTVVYAAANTFTGPMYLEGGVSEITADSGLGAPGTGATINLNGGTILGNATFTLDNSGSNKRGISLGNNGGTLAAVSGDIMTVDGVVSGANPLTIGIPASSSNGNVAGQVPGTGSGTANASVIANGTVALTGNNTYTGGTILDGGTLRISSSTFGTGGIIFNSGTLQWASGTSNDISSQAITFNPSGGTLDVNGNPVTLASVIGNGSGVLTVKSTAPGGALILKGANTYTGGTIVSSGTLDANNTGGSATGTNIVTILSGAALGGNGFIVGDVTWQPGAVASFTSGSQLTVGVVTLNNNTVTVNVPGTTTLVPGTYPLMNYTVAGSTGSFNATPVYTGAGVQPGTTSVISTDSGAVTLTVTAIPGVSRVWVGDGSLNAWDFTTGNWLNGSTPDIYSDGDLVTFDDTGSDSPAINLTTTFQPGSVLVNAAQDYTFSGTGQISGTTALVKTNTGTLTILTANTYSGSTTIGQGTLQLGNGTTAGSLGANIVQDFGSLVFDLPGNSTFANTVSGTGGLTQMGTGILTLTASNTYTGGTTISSGTLQLNTGAWFGSGSVLDNGALLFNSSGPITVAAGINGSGSLALSGSGSVALTANNSYNGGTMVNSGTLLVNNSLGSGTGNGTVTVASSGTLGGSGTIAGAVIINSGGTLSPGNPIGTLTINNSLTANSGATLNFTLGTSSDKIVVNGNLNLAGTLNITNSSGFTTTTYTLISYSGTLTLGSLTLNLPPSTTASIDTNTPGQVNLVVQTLSSAIPAFPGALGFGEFATGARFGGSVYHISNTNDSGTGSFRDAVSQPNRFIVFDVGGTIVLQSAVSCSSSLYIAGQTAPGGIAIIGHEVSFSVRTNDIVRFLRIRPGSIAASTEDAINMGDATNMIFDHLSLEFAPYDTIDATGNDTGGNKITMQNCILANPIGQQFNAHTEALGNTFSWFYNIFASSHNRNPLAKINTIFINNVIYNFEAGYTVANTSGVFSHDIVNNYFISGPATSSASDDFFQMNSGQSVYSSGNLLDSTANGVLGGSSTSPSGVTVLSSPWSPLTTSTPTFSATAAYRYDVSLAGAFPADQVDQLVFNDVTSLGTNGMGGGLWTSQTQTGLGNNGYGVIVPGTAAVDTDGDGIPDYYELATGSNPNVADSLTPGVGGYTKLENYLNWLATPNAVTTTNTPVFVDLSQYARGFTNTGPVYSVSHPTNGTVTLNGSVVNFTPNMSFTGLGSFQFSVAASDGSAMTNTVTVCVTPYNAAPNFATPVFSSISTVGSSMILTGTGGITNANFILLGATNLTGNWVPLSTNVFDGNGNFIVTDPVTSQKQQGYYILELP
ncbi:MAG TPA: autotransporter-associated beta strand repeat-containing protein [Pseudomonadales bacterium]|nr:autotransporter-associated beta strand repeat-containing protein [Pseudomonadales bacterium]